MTAIGKGDWVECVDNRSRDYEGCEERLRLGGLYCVERADIAPCGDPAIWLIEATAACPEQGFRLDRFRPIFRPRADFIEALKAPPKHAPVRTVEPA